jgi:hypothetical protein
MQAAFLKSSSQILQKVQDLKKKYGHYEQQQVTPSTAHKMNTNQSAPATKMTSPDTRNYAIYNGEIVMTNGAGSIIGQ